MFPIHLTLTLSNAGQLQRLAAFVEADKAAEQAAWPRLDSTSDKPVEAPGKPSSATTARSPRTAEEAPSKPAPSAAAPVTTTTDTPQAAAAPSAAAPADSPFEYVTLQKAVNAALAAHGRETLAAIAARHGAPNFKALSADKWAAAHADILALG
jgi:hypothetical protein